MKKRLISDLEKRYMIEVRSKVLFERRNGRITKKACSVCKEEKGVHGHHESYMPEEMTTLIWLCSKHHRKWHASNNAKMPSEEQMKDYFIKERNSFLEKMRKERLLKEEIAAFIVKRQDELGLKMYWLKSDVAEVARIVSEKIGRIYW